MRSAYYFASALKVGGGDENPLPRSLALESPRELLNVGSPDCPLPPFGLEVDRIEAETILLDDAVDTLALPVSRGLPRIPRWTRHTPSPRVISRLAARRRGRSGFDALQQIRRERRLHLPVARLDQPLRCRLYGGGVLPGFLNSDVTSPPSLPPWMPPNWHMNQPISNPNNSLPEGFWLGVRAQHATVPLSGRGSGRTNPHLRSFSGATPPDCYLLARSPSR